MRKLLFFSTIVLLFACKGVAQYNNGGFELLTANGKPKGWILTYAANQDEGYKMAIDSVEKHSGKYALSLEKISDKSTYAAFGWKFDKSFQGKTIEIKAYIKTKEITEGYAGLWMRVEGRAGNLLAEFMEKQGGAKGTTSWLTYSISYKYNQDDVVSISAGGIFDGNGKAWFDDLEILVDGESINQAKVLEVNSFSADTTFKHGSKINLTTLTPQQIINLTFAGQFWGFLKYHHPGITKGKYDWDAELFKLLPNVINAKNNIALSKALETYLDQLPKPELCTTCSIPEKELIALKPDYGDLLNEKIASKSLSDKLIYIKNNRTTGESYYIGMAPNVGNPIFKNERAYANMVYPDAGYRLLTLYRYWAMINYFFPYKHQTDQNWNEVLKEFVSKFIAAKDEKEYALTTVALIAKVSDTHANLWGGSKALESYKGNFVSATQAKFIEKKLVVTNYYVDTLGVKDILKIGDVIVEINGKNVNDLVKAYLPITAASNYETQLRDLPSNFLLRTNDQSIKLKINRKGIIKDVEVPTIKYYYIYNDLDYKLTSGYHLLSDDIGYVYPAKYKNKDLPAIKKLFENTKGMIIDMRCYPSDFMPFTFANYIKKENTPFVKFTIGDTSNPGLFTYTPSINNGGGGDYKGNVIVIVNATSQSNAEYTTMAFQSAPNVRVLGSITAGADGNVSAISLPGGISTMISGIGIFYPDGTPTQRLGVKIDYPMHPSLNGIEKGKDELLEKAMDLLKKGW